MQLLLLHGLGVGGLDHLAHYFLTHLGTVALLHDLERHLARTEAVQTNPVAEILQPTLNLGVDTVGRHLDFHPATETLGGFH